MARPRYKKNEKTAAEKIEDAFWKLLETTRYSCITVAQIVKLAGLNRNSFYYHFENMDDLAHTAVTDAVSPAAVSVMVNAMNGEEDFTITRTPQFKQSVDRFCLIAGKNSSYGLRAMLTDALEQAWCKIIHVDPAKFTKKDKVIVSYLLGGTLSAFAYCADNNIEVPMEEILRSGLSKRVRETLLEIAAEQNAIA